MRTLTLITLLGITACSGDNGENGENEGRVEANEDDVAEGAKTLVFQVDDAPKGAKDGSELIRKGKTWSLK